MYFKSQNLSIKQNPESPDKSLAVQTSSLELTRVLFNSITLDGPFQSNGNHFLIIDIKDFISFL